MTMPAAIRATYSDMKFIKSRSIVQIILEAPIEEAPNVVALLGTPNPASEIWCALARLTGRPDADAIPTTPPQEHSKERRRFSELPPAQQAALTCKREAFQQYLYEVYGMAKTEDGAAVFVRTRCDVQSRSELNTNPEAAERWQRLLSEFDVWMQDVVEPV